jgi:hypothetical protein
MTNTSPGFEKVPLAEVVKKLAADPERTMVEAVAAQEKPSPPTTEKDLSKVQRQATKANR